MREKGGREEGREAIQKMSENRWRWGEGRWEGEKKKGGRDRPGSAAAS